MGKLSRKKVHQDIQQSEEQVLSVRESARFSLMTRDSLEPNGFYISVRKQNIVKSAPTKKYATVEHKCPSSLDKGGLSRASTESKRRSSTTRERRKLSPARIFSVRKTILPPLQDSIIISASDEQSSVDISGISILSISESDNSILNSGHDLEDVLVNKVKCLDLNKSKGENEKKNSAYNLKNCSTPLYNGEQIHKLSGCNRSSNHSEKAHSSSSSDDEQFEKFLNRVQRSTKKQSTECISESRDSSRYDSSFIDDDISVESVEFYLPDLKKKVVDEFVEGKTEVLRSLKNIRHTITTHPESSPCCDDSESNKYDSSLIKEEPTHQEESQALRSKSISISNIDESKLENGRTSLVSIVEESVLDGSIDSSDSDSLICHEAEEASDLESTDSEHDTSEAQIHTSQFRDVTSNITFRRRGTKTTTYESESNISNSVYEDSEIEDERSSSTELVSNITLRRRTCKQTPEETNFGGVLGATLVKPKFRRIKRILSSSSEIQDSSIENSKYADTSSPKATDSNKTHDSILEVESEKQSTQFKQTFKCFDSSKKQNEAISDNLVGISQSISGASSGSNLSTPELCHVNIKLLVPLPDQQESADVINEEAQCERKVGNDGLSPDGEGIPESTVTRVVKIPPLEERINDLRKQIAAKKDDLNFKKPNCIGLSISLEKEQIESCQIPPPKGKVTASQVIDLETSFTELVHIRPLSERLPITKSISASDQSIGSTSVSELSRKGSRFDRSSVSVGELSNESTLEKNKNTSSNEWNTSGSHKSGSIISTSSENKSSLLVANREVIDLTLETPKKLPSEVSVCDTPAFTPALIHGPKRKGKDEGSKMLQFDDENEDQDHGKENSLIENEEDSSDDDIEFIQELERATPRKTGPRKVLGNINGAVGSAVKRAVEKTRLTHVEDKVSFLASLDEMLEDGKRHPEALDYIKNFKKRKDELIRHLFHLFNTEVFECQLPADMSVTWNPRMTKTAGFCYYTRRLTENGISYESRIELSTKVCDRAGRVRDTLLHEMCHAAVWLVYNVRDKHGPFWKSWAQIAAVRFPEIPMVSRCHTYEIATKYMYKCTRCDYSTGRHSKSVNLETHRCPYCRSTLELLVNATPCKSANQETPYKSGSEPRTPRAPNAFALFVKENYGSVKKKGMKHAEVMKALSEQFAAAKVK